MGERHSFGVLVVGAGPAGIAAACAAAESGARVGMVDENLSEGGQIWRGEQVAPRSREAGEWFARLSQTGVRHLPATRVIAAEDENTLLAVSASGSVRLRYGKLILATGARERLLPFPGWTLPNVVAAGGLQALVKGGLPIKDKDVLIAGSGPLLLAVADHLLDDGANVVGVVEQASATRVTCFGLGLCRRPGKLLQGLRIKWQLRRVPQHFGSHVETVEAQGRRLLVTLRLGRRTRRVACDYLACSFGLVPGLELPLLVGCAIHADGFVCVDEFQATDRAGVYAAGELTGIGGVEKALAEGRVAGYAATGEPERARACFARRDAAAAFARRLARAFALPEYMKSLATDETIICRCEDITLGELRGSRSLREAKLKGRCGMGACQGRTCGAALRFLFGWQDAGVRPPAYPVKLEHLARFAASSENSAPDRDQREAAAVGCATGSGRRRRRLTLF